ncbi:MAG TPA: DNA translocase FtsK [Thiotrichales bacterium]|nr:DNA translocase FtsK [Thiotrichales bacterium]
MRLREFLDQPKGREMAGIVLTGLSLLVVIALATYSPRDPSFFTSGPGPARNWIGPTGAQVAALLYEIFGLGAWFLPLMLLAAALRRLRGGDEPLRRSAVAGLGAVGLATSLLLALIVGRIEFRDASLLAGGAAGHMAGAFLERLFGDVGAVILAATVMLAGLALAARSSLAESTAEGAEWLRRAVAAGRASLSRTLGDARSRRRASRPAPKPRVRRSAGEGWMSRLRSWVERPRWWWKRSALAASESPVVDPVPQSEEKIPIVDPPPQPEAVPPPPPRRRRKVPATERQARLPVDPPGAAPPRLPPPELLAPPPRREPVDRQELLAIARQVESRCAEFSVGGKVAEIHPGPVVTTFEFRPEAGIKLSKITGLADDLALGLEAESVRIARIPGRSAVGMEVPNRKREVIALREIVESRPFSAPKDLLTLGLGKTQDGEIFCASLAKMPHLLIAGSTGSGKSVGLNAIVSSILYRARPDEVKFILVDPKMLELGIYEGMPHLLVPVVTDMKLAANALRWGVREMERRYRILAACNVRHLDAYNHLYRKDPKAVVKALEGIPRPDGAEAPRAEPLPYIVIVVDELADMLMTTGQEVEEAIARLAQKARAVGLHLVLATQRPSVDVLTGAIKANFPARIAFRVASKIDSRTILDASGAEKLLGAGDMLYRPPGSSRLLRIHGAWVSEQEGLRLVAWLKQQAEAKYDESVLAEPPDAGGDGASLGGGGNEDPVYRKAVRLVIATGHGSTSFLQRKMRLGYSRAARIVDQMEEEGILGPADGSKPRPCLVGTDFLERMDQQDREAPI